MTKAEFDELISKPSDALTSRDIETLRHLEYMRDLFRDEPGKYDPIIEHDMRRVCVDVTQPGDRVIRRKFVGYERAD